MQPRSTTARFTALALFTALLSTGAAATTSIPELTVVPGHVNWTGNQSIPANQPQQLTVRFANPHPNKTIHNVDPAGHDWLDWNRTGFDIPPNTTRRVSTNISRPYPGVFRSNLTIPYQYNQTDLNESRYNKTWRLTFDKNYYPTLRFTIESYFRATTLTATTLDRTFTLPLGSPDQSAFKLRNIGAETAYNVTLKGDNLTFDTADGFNLTAGDDQLVTFHVAIPKPEQNATQATNRTYHPTIHVDAWNANHTVTIPLNVTVPYRDYTTTERDEQDIATIVDQFKQFCETHNCSTITETVYRNRTVYVNQTPVYQANLTPAMRATLANLSELETENWRLLRDTINLQREATTTQLQNVTTKLQRLIHELERTQHRVDQLNQSHHAERQAEQQRVASGKTKAMLILVGLIIAAFLILGYVGIQKLTTDDNRLIKRQ